ncbi:AfsR/SARP family transcriptional regulator [Hamadaea tsunoensis]|uniref:AfsR/SARP family transcriptional regulator n=1 Tax=Hamadaea tsunoensis TaxID=53368 RepID=UPI00146F9933|nr:BTAD domain-containing putative transcriptional regulator [Hamadaea tsunoensis]
MIRVDDQVVSATPMLRRLVAALLARSGDPVDPDRLADELWQGDPPRTARKTIAVYVHRLRRALGDDDRVTLGPSGYSLVVAPDEVDVLRFAAAGRRTGPEQPPAYALGLWLGEPFRGHRDIEAVDWAARRLGELRADLLEAHHQSLLDEGAGAAAIAGLEAAVGEFPYREAFRGQLMLALYRGGRQADALDVYRDTYKLLMAELGIQPTPALQELHTGILSGDPGLSAPSPVGGRTPPRQLPRVMPDFVGRRAELAWLDGVTGEPGAVAVVSAISGTGGIGKTTLAVQWASAAHPRFPDGQLYINLRGYGPVPPTPPAVALDELLRGIGVPSDEVPETQDEAAALFRSRLADTRMLVLLDNAASVEQVRPLLPGGSGNAVVVTSRSRLSGLVAREGARRLELDALPADEARDLLRTAIGAGRFDADPAATADLLAGCGGLPLALRLVAAQLIDQPSLSLRDLRDRLAADRLNLLSVQDDPDAAIRAVVAASVQRLPPEATVLLRRLSLVPIPEAGLWLAGLLAAAGGGDSVPAALGQLVEASLATVRDGRYHLHDLVQLCAAETADADDAAALRYAYEEMLARVIRADAALGNRSYPTPAWRGTDWVPDDPEGWLQREREVVFAAVRDAAERGWTDLSWRLVASMTSFSGFRRYVADWDVAVTHQLTLDLEPEGRAALLLALGGSLRGRGQLALAARDLSEARRRYARTAILPGTVMAATQLAMTYRALGRYRAAKAAADWAIARRPADTPAIGEFGWTYLALGNLHIDLRELAEARAALEEAVRVFDGSGQRAGTANALASLALALQDWGAPDEVLAVARRAYDASAALDEQDGQCRMDSVIATCLMQLGRLDEAEVHAQRALSTARSTMHPSVVRATLTVAGRVATASGDLDRAHAHLTEALTIARSLRTPVATANTLRYLVRCLAARGEPVAARTAALEAVGLYRDIGVEPTGDLLAWAQQ